MGGQVGGTCDPEAEENKTTIFTTFSDAVTIPGFTGTQPYFTYIAVERKDGTYGIAYGLSNKVYQVGQAPAACVGMSVNYSFLNSLKDSPMGNLMFGVWYENDPSKTDTTYGTVKNTSFDNLDDAKAYADSEEFGKIASVIKSLKLED